MGANWIPEYHLEQEGCFLRMHCGYKEDCTKIMLKLAFILAAFRMLSSREV